MPGMVAGLMGIHLGVGSRCGKTTSGTPSFSWVKQTGSIKSLPLIKNYVAKVINLDDVTLNEAIEAKKKVLP